MACDRFAFTGMSTPAPRRGMRRYVVAEMPAGHAASIAPVLTPGLRARPSRSETHRLAVESKQLAAAQARIAELEAALAEARDFASHDPLTGMFNRRGMNDAFSREYARAKRSGEPLALALIDLDDFKRINDQHGHAVGDAALIHLTAVMKETLRPTDVCCRLGGEEFVVLMPGSDRCSAKKALMRLQAAVGESPVAQTTVTLSFSAGVLTASRTETLDQLLSRADTAVYRAKAAGKRRVVSA